MAGKKKSQSTDWPKITKGVHTDRIEHEDGTVELVTDWDKLLTEVRTAIADYEQKAGTEEPTVKPKAAKKKAKK